MANTLTCSQTRSPVRTPPGFKERLHGERMHSRNACGLINSISGGKDLATSFPCGAGKIPLGNMQTDLPINLRGHVTVSV